MTNDQYDVTWCGNCGGRDVQAVAWYSPNTGELGEHFSECPSMGHTWCNDCEDHHELISGKRCVKCDANIKDNELAMDQPERCETCADTLPNLFSFKMDHTRWKRLKQDRDGDFVVNLPCGGHVAIDITKLPNKLKTADDVWKEFDAQGVNIETYALVWPWFYVEQE